MIHEETDQYSIENDPTGRDYIQCKTCGMRSYGQGDIKYRFCLKCDRFHRPRQNPELLPEERSESSRELSKLHQQLQGNILSTELTAYMKASIVDKEGYEFLYKNISRLEILFMDLAVRFFEELDRTLNYHITDIKEHMQDE